MQGSDAYLSFPVDADDSWRGLMSRGHKNGLSADSVHVNAGARLEVVQVNVAVFGDQEYNILFGADLLERTDHFKSTNAHSTS